MAFIPGYTPGVKTAISLPDDTFHAVTNRARELGMSRSEFFATAARRYLDELDGQSLTARIDQAVADGATDDSSQAASSAGRRHLAEQGDW
jgi:antitoxin MazE6